MMIRIYRLPDKLTDGYCFGGGKPITFTNVDWFGAQPPAGLDVPTPTRAELIGFIREKRYYDPTARFLVLDDRPGETFVLEPPMSDVAALTPATEHILAVGPQNVTVLLDEGQTLVIRPTRPEER